MKVQAQQAAGRPGIETGDGRRPCQHGGLVSRRGNNLLDRQGHPRHRLDMLAGNIDRQRREQVGMGISDGFRQSMGGKHRLERRVQRRLVDSQAKALAIQLFNRRSRGAGAGTGVRAERWPSGVYATIPRLAAAARTSVGASGRFASRSSASISTICTWRAFTWITPSSCNRVNPRLTVSRARPR